MFELIKLLTFPISLPLTGTQWLAGVLLDEAERKLYDEQAILAEMAALEGQLQSGRIGGRAFERRQEALLQRLIDARRYHQAKRDATSVAIAPAAPEPRNRRGGGPGRKATPRLAERRTAKRRTAKRRSATPRTAQRSSDG